MKNAFLHVYYNLKHYGTSILTQLISDLYARLRRPVNVLTHCNAGWLATVDYGTALSPIYMAFEQGTPLHVWVDETRPRNQGLLTAWELGQHGVPYTLVADNAGGQLMQQCDVDLVIVGADRITRRGDVANKIGTYSVAVNAHLLRGRAILDHRLDAQRRKARDPH